MRGRILASALRHRQAEERLRLMVESVQDYALFSTDPAGRVTTWGVGAERVFGYRALRIARGDSIPLPGFDENAYVQTAQFDQHHLADLVAEFQTVRQSQLGLFEHLPTNAWDRRGIANGDEVSVRGLAYIIVGHERHHTAILRRRLSP